MISAEAPIVFSKACEIFILELTLRSWIHTEENKRRTLQKSDVALAVSKADMYDFLIDIVPRDDIPKEHRDISVQQHFPQFYSNPGNFVGVYFDNPGTDKRTTACPIDAISANINSFI